jgi:hypothetical protein
LQSRIVRSPEDNRELALLSWWPNNPWMQPWTRPSLLVTEQSLSAAVNQAFAPGDRTIVECRREPGLLSWWPNNRWV